MVIKRWLLTLIACACVVGSLTTFKVLQIQQAIAYAESFPEPSATVEAVKPVSRMLQHRIETIGEVITPQTIELRNELEGRVVAVNFDSGQKVKAGQVLLRQDTSEERAQLAALRAKSKLAKAKLERTKRLAEQNTASADRLDNDRSEYLVILAEIEALQTRIERKTLVAPFDATVGLHELAVGELLSANTHITTLVGAQDYVWVDFKVPYRSTDQFAERKVWVEFTDGRQTHAEVIAKETLLSEFSRTQKYRARLPGVLPAHTPLRVFVPLGEPTSELYVPSSAVLQDGMGHYVYKLEGEQAQNQYRAVRQPVTLIRSEQELAVISAGAELNEAHLIAANGAFKLQEQLLVFVSERETGKGANQL
ncbi:efflux RND transporter periplasmic adaptor subunit [Pseudoalteromonas sp. DL2-H2.2]|uniref:efflux RND transporter periplasmic adaptor subunit n=1 Tax=Pseudoalteromonas sp. DL2-H2.2 TaxID=2908889 RepID=UPI001F447525|nr:efflux RND transporter periplasmic adaptor subunit [Pseudoalteromonas sp. DL2-H2.2]MCF2910383.1 efflux RND transporter periplasmic adaptor subunit [Pseudoalteromonas sp. DL2-H2.2]